MWPRPTREQALLLRAALRRGPEGLGAWEQWRASASVDALDGDSQWLLPLLYHNLHAQDIAPGLLVRYRNVYLHNWYKNTLTLRQARSALAHLQAVSHAVILLGGGAMALRHYEALGARPFERLSVLARHATMPAGAGVAAGAVDAQVSLFDPGTDGDVVRRATHVQWKTLRCLVLDPADQLVDICVRHRAWDRRSRLLWMADAVTTVRRNPDLDWKRVITLADQVDRRRDVANALRYLHRCLGLDLPSAVRGALEPAAGEGPA
jgi:hypothetical protein